MKVRKSEEKKRKEVEMKERNMAWKKMSLLKMEESMIQIGETKGKKSKENIKIEMKECGKIIQEVDRKGEMMKKNKMKDIVEEEGKMKDRE